MFKNRTEKYFMGCALHSSLCGLLISQGHPCPLPSMDDNLVKISTGSNELPEKFIFINNIFLFMR